MGVEEEALLQSIGLTRNESLVYLSLAALGPASASGIAEKSGVQRTLVYDTLKRLIEQGMVSQVDIDSKKLFQAAGPSKLRAVVEERQKSVLDNVSKLLPLLEKTYATSSRPSVNVYTGIEGLKTVLTQEIEDLPEGGVLKVYRLQPGIVKAAPVFMSWWHKKRIAKKITLKGIVDLSQPALERGKELEGQAFSQVKYLKETLPSPVTYHVFGNKAAIMAMAEEESLGIIIESRVVARSLEENFDFAWDSIGNAKT
ncbi:MAG TPA: helix-turn-helix domain-containing protein [Candidatus Norongarragalinales archaeon]|nr:helix-turn-helix domain-containing protein [Candidatus Norongarragalinales archaeon]